MTGSRSQISALESHLGYWLRLVSNQVSHAFARKLAGREITVAEWVVMRELHDFEASAPSRLAERLGLTRGAISKLADRLIAKGLVKRGPGAPGDRRFQALALTAQGKALVPELAELADANDAEFFGHLSPEERRLLELAMRELARHHDLTSAPVD